MKRLILASILCASLPAQQKPPVDTRLVFPSNMLQQRQPVAQPQIHLLKGLDFADSGICSVPLLEAHVDTFDPGIATTPAGSPVAIPQANVPAPACHSNSVPAQQTFLIDNGAAKQLEWQIMAPRDLKMWKAPDATNGVCSVPMPEAHADAVDPGIANKLPDSAAPGPKAQFPAAPCKK
jgi:hypothetical protein